MTNDQQKVNDTIAMLRLYQRNQSRFFLGVGLSSTHVMRPAGLCSYRAAKLAGFDGSAEALAHLPMPPRRSAERRPPLVTWPNYDLKADSKMGQRKRGMRPSEARQAIGSYFACASHVDNQVGRLLDALDGLQLRPSTAVVVHADHGYSLGRHGRWSKYSLYEEAVRVPLLVSLPGMRTPSAVDDLVEAVDILPTLLDLWGVGHGVDTSDGSQEPTSSFTLGRRRSVRLDGRSLLPFLEAAADADAQGEEQHPTSSRRQSTPAEARSADLTLQEEVERNLYLQQQQPQQQQRQQQQQPQQPQQPQPEPRVISIGAKWPKWYARSELHETYRRNQFDGPVAGGAPADVVWPGAQLWIRTARYAYTAYLELFPANQTISPGSAAAPDTAGTAALALGSFRLVDETLYDTGGSDPEEANNVAYDAAYQAQRARLLDLCLRDWSVRLKGPRDASRGQRLAYLKTSTSGRSPSRAP